jgi:hypothetical protein
VVIKRTKYEMCKNWREKGTCKYGSKCLFAHGDTELTQRAAPVQASKPKEEVKTPTVVTEKTPESKSSTPATFVTPVKTDKEENST